MLTLTEQKPMVRIAYDEMEAYMMLPELALDEAYDVAELRAALEESGVREGLAERSCR